MRIIYNECKKVFRPSIIIILIIVTVLYYQVYMMFEIEHFPNGHPAIEDYELGLEYLERFGTSIDKKELEEIKAMYNNIVSQLDEIVQDQKLEEYNITNWNELENVRDDLEEKYNEQADEAFWNLVNEKPEYCTLIFKEQEIEAMVGDFSDNIKHGGGTIEELDAYCQGGSKAYIERVNEIFSRNWIESIPYIVVSNYRSLFQSFCGLLIFTITILISPYLIRDKLSGIIPMTYTSKIGRALFRKKIIAVIGSSALLILLQTLVFLMVYSRNKTAAFLNCLITADINTEVWYDLTFGQFIIITLVMAAVFGLGASLICFAISKCCSNYIAVIAIDAPMIAILWSASNKIFGKVFEMTNSSNLLYVKNIECYFIALIVMLGMITTWVFCRKEKTRDIL